MGIYLNPGSDKFQEALRSAIYVDKSSMIAYTNRIFKSSNKYICVSRPRRFGKSMAANMLSAYYDRTVDGSAVFQGLAIAAMRILICIGINLMCYSSTCRNF